MKFIIPYIILLCLVSPANALCESDPSRACIDQFKTGRINWTKGVITATGIESPPANHAESPNARQTTLRTASQTALSNLLITAKHVRINSAVQVRHFESGNDKIMAKLENMVRDARIVDRQYLSDGTVQVTAEMSMYGGFSQLLLPQNIKQIESVKPVAVSKPSRKSTVKTSHPTDGKQTGKTRRNPYTGLIIDARGLKALPCLAPRIVDETGTEVYGPGYASREYAVQNGMAGYSTEAESAGKNPRVSGTPLTFKGLKTENAGHCDIVISNADASRLRSAPEHLIFLKKCQIIIILD